MPRKPILTEHTNAQNDAEFSDAEKTLGRLLDPFADSRYAVLLDGIPLGERQNEIRKPGSSFYEKGFLEAISVAHLAANLGFDRDGVVEVLRRPPPRPDIELQVGGITVAFVEQTMVVDEGARKVEVALDELNDAIAKCKDPGVRAALDGGTLTVRLNSLPAEYYNARLPVDELTREVYAVVHILSGATSMMVDGARYPLLGKMNAGLRYLLHGRTNNRVVSIFEHGREEVLPRALADQIRKKSRTATNNYPAECRPLWLLLDIDLHFGTRFDSDRLLPIIVKENPHEFDRVIVQSVRGLPLNVDARCL